VVNDELLFAPEGADSEGREAASGSPWKVLVIDDEEEVHVVTRMVLGDMRFEGKPIECLSAYSAQEGFEKLRDSKDVALVLLDVVMESNQAGLELVHLATTPCASSCAPDSRGRRRNVKSSLGMTSMITSTRRN